MSTQKNENIVQKKQPIWLYIILGAFALMLLGCDISKKAIKTKTNTETQKDVKENSINKTIDFSKIETDDLTLVYEPFDTAKAMRFINAKGDTINAINTKITSKKSKVKTEHNIVSETEENKKDNTIIDEDITQKDKQKEENFDASVLLYAFIGLGIFVVIVLLGFGLFVRVALKKQTQLINTLIQSQL